MKKVYISFLLHGNMCYDRYTKQEIRDKFPKIYAAGVRAMHKFPEVTAHIDFPGLTALSLKHHAPWLLDEMKPLVDRGQIVMLGCQYAANHALCADEESDIVAGRVSMEILRDLLQPDVSTFFPQEIAFHPQSPYIMSQIGATRVVVRPDGWNRPRRVKGIDGTEVNVYPLDVSHGALDKLEAYYDTHEDGDFIMTGGDFEMLGNVGAFVSKLEELADRGKVIEWMTVDRYEKEIGVHETYEAHSPFGNAAAEDRLPNPSFSRWVGDPEDMIWHGHAVQATDAVRAAGFAKVAARLHDLGDVDVPIAEAWTTGPDNVWDHKFEHVLEYPETEETRGCSPLSSHGTPTLLSRAWHHLIIGINSDASGWFPWTPRTRHRNTVLQASRALSNEVLLRFANAVAARLAPPKAAADAYVLALNPAPDRTAEVSLETPLPMAFVDAAGEPITTAVSLHDGRWSAAARVALPAYGYTLLGLVPSREIEASEWVAGDEVRYAGKSAALSDGILRMGEGDTRVEVTVPPFRLSDPSGVAPTEMVSTDWAQADTRIRRTMFGCDLEVFTELAWAVWLRLIIGLRSDRIEVTAELHVDMPRRIGNLEYDPEGLVVQFRGQPGVVYYDVPYATIRHRNDEASFIAAQRFAALESGASSFGLIALGGNQSFKVAANEGVLCANLGTSTQGRADTRPQCIIHPDGTGEHRITSGGDPFMGSYEHRFALVFGDKTDLALAARRLRTGVPLIRVEPGGGDWPVEQSLLNIEPATAHVTAFRVTKRRYPRRPYKAGCEIVLNDVSGAPNTVSSQGKSAWGGVGNAAYDLPPYGVATLRI